VLFAIFVGVNVRIAALLLPRLGAAAVAGAAAAGRLRRRGGDQRE
jgi:hypothetical protein